MVLDLPQSLTRFQNWYQPSEYYRASWALSCLHRADRSIGQNASPLHLVCDPARIQHGNRILLLLQVTEEMRKEEARERFRPSKSFTTQEVARIQKTTPNRFCEASLSVLPKQRKATPIQKTFAGS